MKAAMSRPLACTGGRRLLVCGSHLEKLSVFLIFMQRKRFGPGVLKDVQTVFDRYDSEQKSYLTRRELKLCMIACLGFKPPKVSGPG
jgi:hypothetical protein